MTSAENLICHVAGDIEEVDDVLKITTIRLRYEFKIPAGFREKADRAVETHAAKCPAYQSIKGCIECTWTADIVEE